MTLELILRGFVLPVLLLSLTLSAWRTLRGPSLADRAVGLDLMTTISIALTGVLAILTEQVALLDLGLIVALIAFLGTVGFARYLERQAPGDTQ